MRYFLRALKHFVKMALLVALIYLAMNATDTLGINQQELLGTKGLILLVALVALSAAYPSYGFVERTMEGSIQKDRELLVESMIRGGYSLQREEDGQMHFRASSPIRRLLAMGDDKVTIGQLSHNTLSISGQRKGVVEAEFRISSRLRIGREEQNND